jgi:hypothetical protein
MQIIQQSGGGRATFRQQRAKFVCLRGRFTPDLAAQTGVNLRRSRSRPFSA